jgi:hypothetical protein
VMHHIGKRLEVVRGGTAYGRWVAGRPKEPASWVVERQHKLRAPCCTNPLPPLCCPFPASPHRHSQEAFLFVYNMIVPGTPTLSVVMVFSTDHHPDTLGPAPEDPDEGEWQPFDYAMSRWVGGAGVGWGLLCCNCSSSSCCAADLLRARRQLHHAWGEGSGRNRQ